MAMEKPGDSSISGAEAAASSSLAHFCKVVLGWDYLRLLSDSKKNRQKKPPQGLKPVKNTYTNFEDYIGVFEPLLFEEVKAQIVQGRDEEDGSDWLRGLVGSYTELEGFLKVSIELDHFPEDISINDLLLLSTQKFEVGGKPDAYAFALFENRGVKGTIVTLNLRTFLAGEVKNLKTLKPEGSQRLTTISSALKTENCCPWILKICSLSTVMREYVALHSVSNLPFKDLILSACEKDKFAKNEGSEWNVPKPLMNYLQTNLNDSQIDAIHAGLSRRPFVLIQGPPGTGKTQTILGLLSAVLHSAPARIKSKGAHSARKDNTVMEIQDRYNNWLKASPWILGTNPRDLILPINGDDGFYPTGNELKPELVSTNRKYRAHVLVCAPSNSALDEIVQRVLHIGIHDEHDNVYNPKIVRVGLKAHHSVQAVSMDYLVAQKLGTVDRSAGAKDQDRIRASILDESAIVFSTLSFSGSSAFNRMTRPFDVVIIDEAAQAVEPAIMVPLAHGCRQVFLVGDPVQLPATVISPTAEKLGYGTSLFQRFQEAGYPVQMLNTQYRMHSQISIFPSREFYGGNLLDGESVDRKKPWHGFRCMGPFCFFDILDSQDSQPSGSQSWVNKDEIDFIILLYHQIATRFPELRSSNQVAVISPYAYQVKFLKDKFRETFGDGFDQVVDINTVDGFQGREKELVIFSCVRANEKNEIGFTSDFRRMNVGITRARSSVLVVGSAKTLYHDKHWKNLVDSAKHRQKFFEVAKPYLSFFEEEERIKVKLEEEEREKEKEKNKEVNGEQLEMMQTGEDATGEDNADNMDDDDMGVGYDEED